MLITVQFIHCHVQLFVTPWTAAHQAFPSITNSRSLLKLMSSSSVMPSNHLILCHHLLLLPSILPASGSFSVSQFFESGGQSIGLSVSAHSFIHSFIPMNIHDWFHLDWLIWSPCNQRDSQEFSPAPSSKAPILRRSAFFMVQLLHPYMNTGKTIAFSTRTFVHKVMSLLFNMLSSLVIAFLPRSKRLLISWLQSPSAVILECEKIKSLHYFHCFPIYLPWNDGTGCHDLRFLNVEL